MTNRNHDEVGRAFGSDLPWDEARGHIFRAVSLRPFAVIDGDTVRAISPSMPYGVLRVECPALGNDLLIPLTHKDEFYTFAVLLNEEGGVPKSEEVIVSFLPSKGLMKAFSAAIPRIRASVVPAGQLEKLYRAGEPTLTEEQLRLLFTSAPRCWNCNAKVSSYMLRCRKCHVAVLQHYGPDAFRQLRRANQAR